MNLSIGDQVKTTKAISVGRVNIKVFPVGSKGIVKNLMPRFSCAWVKFDDHTKQTLVPEKSLQII